MRIVPRLWWVPLQPDKTNGSTWGYMFMREHRVFCARLIQLFCSGVFVCRQFALLRQWYYLVVYIFIIYVVFAQTSLPISSGHSTKCQILPCERDNKMYKLNAMHIWINCSNSASSHYDMRCSQTPSSSHCCCPVNIIAHLVPLFDFASSRRRRRLPLVH